MVVRVGRAWMAVPFSLMCVCALAASFIAIHDCGQRERHTRSLFSSPVDPHFLVIHFYYDYYGDHSG